MTRRPVVAVVLGLLVVSIGIPVTSSRPAAEDPKDVAAQPATGSTTPSHAPSAVPIPGHEVYGFVPYGEMDAGIADHLAATDLSTVGLFSVTNRKNGTLDTGQN